MARRKSVRITSPQDLIDVGIVSGSLSPEWRDHIAAAWFGLSQRYESMYGPYTLVHAPPGLQLPGPGRAQPGGLSAIPPTSNRPMVLVNGQLRGPKLPAEVASGLDFISSLDRLTVPTNRADLALIVHEFVHSTGFGRDRDLAVRAEIEALIDAGVVPSRARLERYDQADVGRQGVGHGALGHGARSCHASTKLEEYITEAVVDYILHGPELPDGDPGSSLDRRAVRALGELFDRRYRFDSPGVAAQVAVEQKAYGEALARGDASVTVADLRGWLAPFQLPAAPLPWAPLDFRPGPGEGAELVVEPLSARKVASEVRDLEARSGYSFRPEHMTLTGLVVPGDWGVRLSPDHALSRARLRNAPPLIQPEFVGYPGIEVPGVGGPEVDEPAGHFLPIAPAAAQGPALDRSSDPSGAVEGDARSTGSPRSRAGGILRRIAGREEPGRFVPEWFNGDPAEYWRMEAMDAAGTLKGIPHIEWDILRRGDESITSNDLYEAYAVLFDADFPSIMKTYSELDLARAGSEEGLVPERFGPFGERHAATLRADASDRRELAARGQKWEGDYRENALFALGKHADAVAKLLRSKPGDYGSEHTRLMAELRSDLRGVIEGIAKWQEHDAPTLETAQITKPEPDAAAMLQQLDRSAVDVPEPLGWLGSTSGPRSVTTHFFEQRWEPGEINAGMAMLAGQDASPLRRDRLLWNLVWERRALEARATQQGVSALELAREAESIGGRAVDLIRPFLGANGLRNLNLALRQDAASLPALDATLEFLADTVARARASEHALRDRGDDAADAMRALWTDATAPAGVEVSEVAHARSLLASHAESFRSAKLRRQQAAAREEVERLERDLAGPQHLPSQEELDRLPPPIDPNGSPTPSAEDLQRMLDGPGEAPPAGPPGRPGLWGPGRGARRVVRGDGPNDGRGGDGPADGEEGQGPAEPPGPSNRPGPGSPRGPRSPRRPPSPRDPGPGGSRF